MKTIIFAILALHATLSCIATTCNAYSQTANVCYQNRSNSAGIVAFTDFYGGSINNKFHYCPEKHLYCDIYSDPYNQTAFCKPMFGVNSPCFTGYQCITGLCVLGKCAEYQGSTNIACNVNPDCEYGLVCLNNKCANPLASGAVCHIPTTLNFYDMTMDSNECDYTKNYICAVTGTSLSYTCLKMFTITSSTFVSNALLCSTMVTDKGWNPGNCIVNRKSSLPALQYDPKLNYKVCTTDNDCLYSLAGSQTYTISGSCQCALFDTNALSYCNFGGGEDIMISSVAYYQKYWIPQYRLMYDLFAWKYAYALDNTIRNELNNPAYCSFTSFVKNVSIEPSNNGSTTILYIVILVLFATALIGLIVTFLVC